MKRLSKKDFLELNLIKKAVSINTNDDYGIFTIVLDYDLLTIDEINKYKDHSNIVIQRIPKNKDFSLN